MPPKRFWEKPGDAPAHLDSFPARKYWLSHHTRKYADSDLTRMLTEGILSYQYSSELGRPVTSTPGTLPEHEDSVFFWKINRPLEEYDLQAHGQDYGLVRFLVSSSVRGQINLGSETISGHKHPERVVVQKRVLPQHIAGVIVPDEKTREENGIVLKNFLKAAKNLGVPVYETNGKRILAKI